MRKTYPKQEPLFHLESRNDRDTATAHLTHGALQHSFDEDEKETFAVIVSEIFRIFLLVQHNLTKAD